ncbi:hypothetical protein [Nocardia seriolae]|uniref:Uncharacterized protein n=1 Tax=Nocardia seriolae TaxID=37332 RepID=A0A0B8NEN6_9NOCA|nr:hypothetical protein [Nocardia seriolae]APA95746.1 hypothetical protein NS506_01677 [Nocardia seriolae]MTJ66138.1 hypothetical protein [Nocardia seriolae]MTJ73255.1 hypothetical protein [Nocardia seriolae]MTJ85947.1 hypothetical protein [Nocardia seriolae]MTK29941.1 hypothetical protein [Nocardia seriolae]
MTKKFLAAALLAAASTATILGSGTASADDNHIYFAYGTDNGHVDGRLIGFSHDTWKLDARGGQVMIVDANPNWSDVVVTITGPTGTLSYQRQWSRVTLPVTGTYELTVTSPHHNTIDYGMNVKID